MAGTIADEMWGGGVVEATWIESEDDAIVWKCDQRTTSR